MGILSRDLRCGAAVWDYESERKSAIMKWRKGREIEARSIGRKMETIPALEISSYQLF